MTKTPFGIVALLCVDGAGIPVMAAVNAGLGLTTETPVLSKSLPLLLLNLHRSKCSYA